jgi:RimJ/RimL family protein N-acetyltransferase
MHADAPALHAITGNADVMRAYVDRPSDAPGWSLRQTQEFIAQEAAVWARGGVGRWGIEHEGRLVGYCGLTRLTYLPAPPGTLEASCRLHPDVWGQGLAAEAVTAAVTYAFEERGFSQVALVIAEDNARAQAAVRKQGLSLLGSYPYVSPTSGRSAVFLVWRVSAAEARKR